MAAGDLAILVVLELNRHRLGRQETMDMRRTAETDKLVVVAESRCRVALQRRVAASSQNRRCRIITVGNVQRVAR